MIGIYKITNNINGKIYIGQSRNIESRWQQHQEPARNSLISRAIKKYGVDNFTFEVIEECTIEELDKREIYWIDYYKSFDNGYNLTRGGEKGFFYDLEAIVNDYQETQNIAETARHIGCARQTAMKILHSFGVFGEESSNRPVDQIDPNTLEILHTYNSINEAGRALGVDRTAILFAITGKHNSSCNYFWQYSDEPRDFSNFAQPKKWKVSVAQIDRQTNEIIQIFESASAAAEALGKDRKNGGSQITAVCNGRKKSAYGYIWQKL